MNEKIVSDDIFPLIREKLQSGGNVSVTVTGNSMYPYFHGGKDTVELCPILRPLRNNDIAFYVRKDGTYVLHRVIKIKDAVLYCRGDNQFGIPEKVDAASVFGRVCSYTSNGRKYTGGSFRSRAVLCYIKAFYYFRRLYRKLSKKH